MTGLLQPLDVAVNRSFQHTYEERFNEYLLEQEKKGMAPYKIPDYRKVTEWLVNWNKSFKIKLNRDPLKICGIVSTEEYDIENLHDPLKELLKAGKNINEWESMFKDEIFETHDIFICDKNTHFFPEEDNRTLVACLKKVYGNKFDFLNDVEDQQVDTNIFALIGEELQAVVVVKEVGSDFVIRKVTKYNNGVEKNFEIFRLENYFFIKTIFDE